ncbi:hypothetical protein TREES_T100021436 [Tupaia chinensis]|uniref:Uncharacterized protein n=1 Tax=Tupaia chinensis TaxID=246437 RepID=L9L649_TUPCH|nr:hypothetical protein TREES_T100021436 [Tupaia chinensis]
MREGVPASGTPTSPTTEARGMPSFTVSVACSLRTPRVQRVVTSPEACWIARCGQRPAVARPQWCLLRTSAVLGDGRLRGVQSPSERRARPAVEALGVEHSEPATSGELPPSWVCPDMWLPAHSRCTRFSSPHVHLPLPRRSARVGAQQVPVFRLRAASRSLLDNDAAAPRLTASRYIPVRATSSPCALSVPLRHPVHCPPPLVTLCTVRATSSPCALSVPLRHPVHCPCRSVTLCTVRATSSPCALSVPPRHPVHLFLSLAFVSDDTCNSRERSPGAVGSLVVSGDISSHF